MQKLVERIFWITLLLVTLGAGTAYAVRVSGPGQNTKANSLSVAVASDQTVGVAESVPVPTKLTTVTPSDSTDTSSYCQRGIRVGVIGDAGLALYGTGQDAGVNDAGVASDTGSVILSGVTAGTFIQGSFQRVMASGTSVTGITCFGQ